MCAYVSLSVCVCMFIQEHFKVKCNTSETQNKMIFTITATAM